MPYTPSRSVIAMECKPKSAAYSTNSSGWLAPSKNEPLLLHHSGTYSFGIIPLAPEGNSSRAGGRNTSTRYVRCACEQNNSHDRLPRPTSHQIKHTGLIFFPRHFRECSLIGATIAHRYAERAAVMQSLEAWPLPALVPPVPT